MAKTEIRVTGFGGQGVILCGYLIGKSASIHDGKEATLNQSFGPEARGSACSAQVIVSDDKILYPYLTKPDILISMSQEAYTKFEPELKNDGLLLVDEDLIMKARDEGIVISRFLEKKLEEHFTFIGAVSKVKSNECSRREENSNLLVKIIYFFLSAIFANEDTYSTDASKMS